MIKNETYGKNELIKLIGRTGAMGLMRLICLMALISPIFHIILIPTIK